MNQKTIPADRRFTLPNTFDTFARAAADQVDGACEVGANMRILRDSVSSRRSEWLCNHNRSSIREIMTTVRSDLMNSVDLCRAMIADELPLPKKPRRRIVRGQESGDTLCHDRYLRRVPECWSRMQREPRIVNRVRIAVNLSTPWHLHERDTIWRGAITVALADELTARGVQVEVVGCKCCTGWFADDNGYILWTTQIKGFSDPLNLSMLTKACCDLAFYRGVFLMGALMTSPRPCCGSLGSPRPMTRYEVDADILIDHDIRTQNDAYQKAQDFMQQLLGQSSGQGRMLEDIDAACGRGKA